MKNKILRYLSVWAVVLAGLLLYYLIGGNKTGWQAILSSLIYSSTFTLFWAWWSESLHRKSSNNSRESDTSDQDNPS